MTQGSILDAETQESKRSVLHLSRGKEFFMMMASAPATHFENVLEIGSGDGFQSSLLKNISSLLVSSDIVFPHSRITGVQYVQCDAQHLPLKSNAINMIFTSSVLEHIPNKRIAMTEMKKCLSRDGIMIHIMPTRTWKVMQILFYYPYAMSVFLKIGRGWLRKLLSRNPALPGDDAGTNNGIRFNMRDVGKYLSPPIHGEYKTHLEEFIAYGVGHWKKFFESEGLQIITMKKLVLCSGYCFGFETLRKWGERLGFASTWGFIVNKRDGRGHEKQS